MKIVKITYKETYCPQSVSGTGFTESDIFEVIDKNGNISELFVDTWYCTLSSFKEIFVKAALKEYGNVENMQEAFIMYMEALVNQYKNSSNDWSDRIEQYQNYINRLKNSYEQNI